jgi:hypothetical protein
MKTLILALLLITALQPLDAAVSRSDAEALVNDLFLQVLKRTPDAGSLDGLSSGLVDESLSVVQVTNIIANSGEALERFGQARVPPTYWALSGQDLNSGGRLLLANPIFFCFLPGVRSRLEGQGFRMGLEAHPAVQTSIDRLLELYEAFGVSAPSDNALARSVNLGFMGLVPQGTAESLSLDEGVFALVNDVVNRYPFPVVTGSMVTRLYEGLFGRTPGTDEIDFWLSVSQGNPNPWILVWHLTNSAEFRQRWSTTAFPMPSTSDFLARSGTYLNNGTRTSYETQGFSSVDFSGTPFQYLSQGETWVFDPVGLGALGIFQVSSKTILIDQAVPDYQSGIHQRGRALALEITRSWSGSEGEESPLGSPISTIFYRADNGAILGGQDEAFLFWLDPNTDVTHFFGTVVSTDTTGVLSRRGGLIHYERFSGDRRISTFIHPIGGIIEYLVQEGNDSWGWVRRPENSITLQP